MPKLLDEMKESGCQSLFIGLESINSKSLQSVHKVQNSVNRYEKLVDEVHKRGIMINASFVFGLISDSQSTYLVITSKIQTYYKLVIMFEFLAEGINEYEEC